MTQRRQNLKNLISIRIAKLASMRRTLARLRVDVADAEAAVAEARQSATLADKEIIGFSAWRSVNLQDAASLQQSVQGYASQLAEKQKTAGRKVADMELRLAKSKKSFRTASAKLGRMEWTCDTLKTLLKRERRRAESVLELRDLN